MARPPKFNDAKPRRLTIILHPNLLRRIEKAAERAGVSKGDWIAMAATAILEENKGKCA